MDLRVTSNYRQPTILIISNHKAQLPLSSSILASFALFYIIFHEQETLTWIQQHQPDLILLDLEEFEALLPLVTTLKLDWLTRDIPLIAIVDSAKGQLCRSASNYDACLSKPFSANELEQKVGSLVSTHNCKFYSQAV